MGILGNMKVLPFLSCVLTSLRYQNGYYGCGGSQRYHYGRCAMLKLIFVAPKFRLRRVKKNGEKRAKNEKLRFAKITIFFFACSRVGHCSGGQYGSEKPCGKGVLAKKIF